MNTTGFYYKKNSSYGLHYLGRKNADFIDALYAVAKEAGCSRSAVSQHLNGKLGGRKYTVKWAAQITPNLKGLTPTSAGGSASRLQHKDEPRKQDKNVGKHLMVWSHPENQRQYHKHLELDRRSVVIMSFQIKEIL